MNDFTASNGITVFVREGGTVQFQHGMRDESCGILQVMPGSEWWEALREFFQAEADERLGRWRWPENQDYVVYHDKTAKGRPTDGTVVVLHEPSGDRGWYDPGGLAHAIDGGTATHISAAALAYFSAHPRREPKPWHDAKPGEGWVVDIGSAEYPNLQAVVVSNEGKFLLRDGGSMPVDRDYIRSGRRIHPEVAS